MTKRDTYGSPREWFDLCARVDKRADNKCEECGKPKLPGLRFEHHHIIPLSRGGTTCMANVKLLCETCHDSKHRHRLNHAGSAFTPGKNHPKPLKARHSSPYGNSRRRRI